jgi:predicted RNA-binding Zn ribbon-like protein
MDDDNGTEGRVGAATPPALVRVEDFLNTLDERRFARRGRRHAGGDRLATEADLAAWLAGQGLLRPGERVNGESFALAMALRRGLRATLAARAGQGAALDADALTALPSLPLRLAVDCGGGAALLPAEDGARGAVAALAADVAVAAVRGAWPRLKMCGHDECRWIFYDGSRNGLGRWCAMDVCGNRVKTRAYRQRHAVRHGS